DPSTDTAVLQVKALSRALTPVQLGNSDDVHVGDAVVAIGNPFGLERTVTAGIVSALQRVIQAPNAYSIDHVIQTDAPINKGSAAAKAGRRAGKQQVTGSGETYPLGGDLIVRVDSAPLMTLDQLRDVIAGKQPGDNVALVIYRGAKRMTLDIKLGRQPSTP